MQFTRRRVVQLAAVAGASVFAAACGDDTKEKPASKRTTLTAPTATTGTAEAAECTAEVPQEPRGPYPADGSDGPNVLVQDGVVHGDLRASFGVPTGRAEGVPLSIELTLKDLAGNCAIGTGLAVYVWQCDRAGNFSLYSNGAADQNYLRGVQVADDQGRVYFTSVFPGCYENRWPHFYFEVFASLQSATDGENARLRSQIALPEDACRAVFEDPGYKDSARNLSRLTLDKDIGPAVVTGDPHVALTAAVTIGVA